MADLKRWLTQNGAPWRRADRPRVAHGFRSAAAPAPRYPQGFRASAIGPNDRRKVWLPANDWDDEETHLRDLLPASCLTEIPAFNEAGDRLGTIETLSLDRTSGRVVYALLRLHARNAPAAPAAPAAEVALPLPWPATTAS